MYFVEERDLSHHQARYLNLLSKFNIKIIYRLNSQNIKTNTLTRILGSMSTDLANIRLQQ